MPPLPDHLQLGPLRVETPVVLAPMAGITNAAFRRLCAEQGAGLYVCEMITSRGLVERDETTRRMLVFDELESVRSVQLYGTDPVYVGKAAEILNCHEAILDRIASGAAEAADEAVRGHLSGTLSKVDEIRARHPDCF